MEASLSLPFRSVRPRLHRAPATTSFVTCGLRNSTRRPLWRSDVLSTEAIRAVQSLKLAKSTPRLNHVLSTTLARLLKSDLLNTFAELKRQNEVDLALKVFEYVCKEEWYGTDFALRCDVIQLLGKNKMVALAEVVFSGLLKEGVELDARAYAEMIGAYLSADMIENAMQTYEKMKAAGCTPNEFTLMILIRNLEKAEEKDLVEFVKRDCVEYLDSPKKFLEEVKRKYPKRRSFDLV